MATITGLTAERMLEIEAESIVDGDVVGNNLILRRHDGTTIDAGPVRGPKGDQGSAGVSAAMASTPVFDVGVAGQIRAGRLLSVTDFTNMGLVQPIGLFNLSDLSNLGSGGPLVNKGAVPFGVGINGAAASAAVFSGSSAQGLYIADAGAADPFRIKVGTFGCWFRTAKRAWDQALISKWGVAGQNAYEIRIDAASNAVRVFNSVDGTSVWAQVYGGSDVCDDRWHFVAVTHDAQSLKLYIDGALDGAATSPGTLFPGASPFNIGAEKADAASAAVIPHYGRVDEAFITSDVLSDDQLRFLYCAKIAHGYGSTPKSVLLNVHRRRKGAPLATSDFPATPRRLYNFTNGSLLDAGVDNAAANNVNGAVPVNGADGSHDGAFQFNGSNQYLTAPTTGLPSGSSPRSAGCWFRSTDPDFELLTINGGGATDFRFLYVNGGTIRSYDSLTSLLGPTVNDGLWHFAVITIDNAPGDGLKRKMYVDGRLVASDSALTPNVLGTALLYITGYQGSSAPSDYIQGAIDGVFITDYVLTPEQIRLLYIKSSQDLGASPKNPGDHIEGFDATNIYATFDMLEAQQLIDLAVMA